MPRKLYEKICKKCGRKFHTRDSRISKGWCCSLSCAAALSSLKRVQAGEKNNNWKGGVSLSYSERKKRYTEKYPEKALAHKELTKAIRTGRVIRTPCQKCGKEKVEGHHEDYSKPLTVIWLCKKHHIEAHKGRFGG